ncbi:hypothetical protein C1H46_000021 [Malus baccata]|uniref:Uncharacterized protein n=1 Tax=Malus baccata TaxID=106549 RepID=A0A540NST5_MALBA|nr:hypothetical protein C1H46_000021 [Malus baccata]
MLDSISLLREPLQPIGGPGLRPLKLPDLLLPSQLKQSSPLPETTAQPASAVEEPIVAEIPIVPEVTSPKASQALPRASQPTSSKAAGTTHPHPKTQGSF